jgi:hypothetical protein
MPGYIVLFATRRFGRKIMLGVIGKTGCVPTTAPTAVQRWMVMGMARGLADGLLRFCNGAWRDNDGDAVDIVEVIRCKDCKYFQMNPFDGCEVCTHISGYVRPDFGCVDGKRKENG